MRQELINELIRKIRPRYTRPRKKKLVFVTEERNDLKNFSCWFPLMIYSIMVWRPDNLGPEDVAQLPDLVKNEHGKWCEKNLNRKKNSDGEFRAKWLLITDKLSFTKLKHFHLDHVHVKWRLTKAFPNVLWNLIQC